MNMDSLPLLTLIKNLPNSPGVYLFKNEHEEIIYIGKAKNLKKRVMQYVQRQAVDLKADMILTSSTRLDFIVTESELAAMLLEAQLIQSHQPRFNVLLKSGQPFLYILITSGNMPEIKLVRNKQQKGSYFGPFLDKGSARRVYDFLIKTFRLKRCKTKIEQGCLNYHMGLCAGSCRPDFDKKSYCQRMELARLALKQGHSKFLAHLQEEIAKSNQEQTFEKSRELYDYYKAFSTLFQALETKSSVNKHLGRKDVWIMTSDYSTLYLFDEIHGVFKKKQVFYFPFLENDNHDENLESFILEYLISFYRINIPAATILVNFDMSEHERSLLEKFLSEWHHLGYDISITRPHDGHAASLIRLGRLHAEQEDRKRQSLGHALKMLFMLPYEPKTIDCFDISHKQGMFMVGSCIRFSSGQPDKKNFRKFHIKTVNQIDDYASLREIVLRRYAEPTEIPDLILIDGGKGQLSAVCNLFPDAEFASLAKREETVYSKRIMEGKKLDPKSFAGQMLIALRDYAHHFAISFHRSIEKL